MGYQQTHTELAVVSLEVSASSTCACRVQPATQTTICIPDTRRSPGRPARFSAPKERALTTRVQGGPSSPACFVNTGFPGLASRP